MNALLWINRVLLTLLSLSTAAVKLARMEAEMLIFRNVGFPDGLTLAFGLLQLVGALLLLLERTTAIGAWIMAVTFVLATGVLFANGMLAFGVASLVFPAMAVLHAAKWPKRERGPACASA